MKALFINLLKPADAKYSGVVDQNVDSLESRIQFLE